MSDQVSEPDGEGENAARWERAESIAAAYLGKAVVVTGPVKKLTGVLFKLGLLAFLVLLCAVVLMVGVTTLTRVIVVVVVALVLALPIYVLWTYHGALDDLAKLPASMASGSRALRQLAQKLGDRFGDDSVPESKPQEAGVLARGWAARRQLVDIVSTLLDVVGPDNPIAVLASPFWTTLSFYALIAAAAYLFLALPLLAAAVIFFL